MKRIIALIFVAVFAAALASGCAAPNIGNGKIVSADRVKYINAKPYSEGLAAIKTEDGWGFIDKEGATVIEPGLEAVGSFSEGLCAAIVNPGEKWGYIDKSGNVAVGGAYTAAADFSDGFALVKDGNYYKYINAKGAELKVTVPSADNGEGTDAEKRTLTSFSDAASFSNGLARVEIDGKTAYINTQGDVVASGFLTENDFSEGLCAVNFKTEKEDLNGFIGIDGATVIEPKYLDTGSFSEGYAPFKAKISEGTSSASGVTTGAVYSWGYINAKGEITVSAEYDNVYGFKNGLSRVSENIATSVYDYSYIDATGKTVTEKAYRFAYDMTSDGLARVARTENQKTIWGFIDRNGAERIAPQYDNAKDFSEGYAPVCIGKKWGIIDKNGRLAAKAEFDDIETASEGHFLVRHGDRYGFLKING